MSVTHFSIETRLNNVVYECQFDKHFYNAATKKAYCLTQIVGLVPDQQGKMTIARANLLICEDCYKKNSDEIGLRLREPSNIVVSTQMPNKLVKKPDIIN